MEVDAGMAIAAAIGALASKGIDALVRLRKDGREERASVTASAHAVTEDAASVADMYKALLAEQRKQFDELRDQEREHCDERLAAMQQQVDELRARVRELEDHQSGAVDVTALRAGATR